MHSLARHLQAQGRGNDTVLVHMTPREVGGLQALAQAHGGTLTRNPTTGLPEAGFLDSILPMIAGVGLNFLLPGIGTALGGALGGFLAGSPAIASGLLVGGGTAAATGDLGKGLMAGLGAYGGAGTAGSLAPGWTAAAKGGIGDLLGASTAAAPTTVPTTAPAPMVASRAGAGVSSNPFLLSPAQQAALNPNTVISDTGQTIFSPAAQATQAGALNTPALTTAQTAASNAPAAAAKGLGGISTMSLAALGLPLLATMGTTPGATTATPAAPQSNYNGPYVYPTRTVSFPTTQQILSNTAEYQYFTPVSQFPGYVPATQMAAKGGQIKGLHAPLSKKHTDLPDGSFVMDARSVSEIGNGSSSAGADILKRIGGTHLKGPGDGVSDSIPAKVDAHTDARVARDEVKFSPEAVKRLGGGSEKKGAAKLYALMHKATAVRRHAARGGDTKLRGLFAIK